VLVVASSAELDVIFEARLRRPPLPPADEGGSLSMNTSTATPRCRGVARLRLAAQLLLFAGLGLALTATLGATNVRAAAACKPGPTTINGQPAEVFCGPATATVRVQGKTLHFTGGTCTKAFSRLLVSIGTEILTRATVQTQPYFGASLPLKPGGKGSKAPTVAWASGRSHGASPLVALEGPLVRYTLSKSFKSGTFSGVTYPGKQRFSGVFSC
jgi:hypothetical protein